MIHNHPPQKALSTEISVEQQLSGPSTTGVFRTRVALCASVQATPGMNPPTDQQQSSGRSGSGDVPGGDCAEPSAGMPADEVADVVMEDCCVDEDEDPNEVVMTEEEAKEFLRTNIPIRDEQQIAAGLKLLELQNVSDIMTFP